MYAKLSLVLFLLFIHINAKGIPIDSSIQLSDGRTLGFTEYGDLEGYPILYFHGGQESRLSAKFMDKTAKYLGIRIIAPERPGIGRSSFQTNRIFLDWGKDVAELADTLSIGCFSIFGLSGGAPHVLACLSTIPNRIENASIISGTTPYHYKGTLKGVWFPVKLVHWFAASKKDKNLRAFIQRDYEELVETPEKRMKQFQKYLPKPDRALILQQPTYGWEFIEGSTEAYCQGINGVVQEWKLYVADWGFELKDIKQPINLWYGTSDKMTPKYKGYYYNEILPNSTLYMIENEGHFSLIRNHLTAILKELRP